MLRNDKFALIYIMLLGEVVGTVWEKINPGLLCPDVGYMGIWLYFSAARFYEGYVSFLTDRTLFGWV